jgi:protein ImuB
MGRLGSQCVLQAAPIQTHIPERAVRYQAAALPAGKSTTSIASPIYSPHRPTILLRDPRSLTLVPASPVTFDFAGQRFQITQVVGPERISGEWWRTDEPTRDYFRVMTHDGRWWWICHHIETDRWLLHGLWA